MRFQVKLKVRLKVRFLDKVSGAAERGSYLNPLEGQDRTERGAAGGKIWGGDQGRREGIVGEAFGKPP